MSGITDAIEALTRGGAAGAERPQPPLDRRGPGRPPGKRSDPAFRQYGVLLRSATHADALDRLRRREPRRDFGDLVQALLEHWLSQTEGQASR